MGRSPNQKDVQDIKSQYLLASILSSFVIMGVAREPTRRRLLFISSLINCLLVGKPV